MSSPPSWIVHRAGPVESEHRSDGPATRHVSVQRCLKCEALLAENVAAFRVGDRVAVHTGGGAVYLVEDDALSLDERYCGT